MADTTSIAWARSTFNPWIGCTEVSPGCDGCYARELDKRHRYGGAEHWGAGVPRFHTSEPYWRKPAGWNRLAQLERASGKIEDRSDWHTPGFWPVFPSMCDPFDNEIDALWRNDLWALVLSTPALTWLLLTKRIGNAAKMLPHPWPWHPPANVWLGASVVNQEEADRDIPKLLATPAAKRFVSYEPALGPVNFRPWLTSCGPGIVSPDPHGRDLGIDQVIVGGESSQGKHPARPFVIGWARDVMRQCAEAKIAFFMKQFGSNATNREGERHPFRDRAGADPAEWPQDLRVQEFPA